MRTFRVDNNKESVKLSKFLYDKFPNMPNAIFYKALRNKDIKVNEKRVTCDVSLNPNDSICIYIDDTLLFNLPKKIDIIYEDDNIAAIFKPQGLLSNDEFRNKTDANYEPTLEDLVLKEIKGARICHRLDRNTAGLVIFAKNDEAYNELLNGFKARNVTKNYLALVIGILEKKHDVLKDYIMYDKKLGISKIYSKPNKNTQEVITEYKVIKENKTLNTSMLLITLHTGKMHQIRAHLKSILHPIIGDSKYGINEINKRFKKHKQMLVAFKYSFSFESTSYLYYLNNVTISLKDEYITKILNIESR